jgi:hypothetical protein
MVEIAIAKLKRYKLSASDHILAELIEAGGEILHPEIHKLINSIWNKEKLLDQWKECSNYCTINFIQNFIQYSSLKIKSIHR